jgi:hypothetical protein
MNLHNAESYLDLDKVQTNMMRRPMTMNSKVQPSVYIWIAMLLAMGSFAHAQSPRVDAWEKKINEERQPPEEVNS